MTLTTKINKNLILKNTKYEHPESIEIVFTKDNTELTLICGAFINASTLKQIKENLSDYFSFKAISTFESKFRSASFLLIFKPRI